MHPAVFPFSETLVAPLRDYPEWHKGRSRYALWMIPVDCPLVLDYVQRAAGQLADLLHPTRRQPHITLFVCGFEQQAQRYNDDFTDDQLQQQRFALETGAASCCTLQIGRPHSFASAAYLSVTDPGAHLVRWRTLLAENCREIRQLVYVPHITLGLYRKKITAEQLQQRLGEIAAPAGLELPVKRLEYAVYSSFELFGRLATNHVVHLPA